MTALLFAISATAAVMRAVAVLPVRSLSLAIWLAARQTSPLRWVCPALVQVIHSESATSDDDEIPSVIRHFVARGTTVSQQVLKADLRFPHARILAAMF